jgi:hypothetical protein
MAWYDDIANSVGFSSRSLGINTAEDKAAREKAAQDAEIAARNEKEQARLAKNKEVEDRYYKEKYGVNADYIRDLDTPKPLHPSYRPGMADVLQQDRNQLDKDSSEDAYMRERYNSADTAMNRPSMADMQRQDRDVVSSMPDYVPEESTWDKIRHATTDARKKYITGGVDKAMDFVKNNPNAAAAGLGILGAGGGYLAAKGDYQDALNTLRQSADLAGTYEALGPSQVAGIKDNQQLKDMQMQALKKTQEEALMGTTAEDEAYRRQQEKLVNQGFKSREAQQQDDLARRGAQAGSGLGMMQALANNQAALQQGSEAADADMLRKAQARRMAVGNLANQSGSMQQAEFNRDVTRGTAADQFNMTNVQNKMAAAQQKAGRLGSVANAQANIGKTKGELGTSLGNLGMQGALGFPELNKKTK